MSKKCNSEQAVADLWGRIPQCSSGLGFGLSWARCSCSAL